MDIIITITLIAILFGITTALLLLYSRKQRVSERSQLQQQLSQSQQELCEKDHCFTALFTHATLGTALLHLDGQLYKANPAFCQLFGYNQEDMLNHNYFYLIQPENLRDLHLNIQALIDNKLNFYQAEQLCVGRNGEMVWVLATVSLIRDIMNVPAYFVLQLQNISLLKSAEERLLHTSYYDPLTSLPNRNKFEQELRHYIAMAQRHEQSFGVMQLDLDRFKNIQDNMGKDAADTLLRVVAQRLSKTVRNTDLVARFGEDEFALIITDLKKPETVAMIGEKILSCIFKPIIVNGNEVYITASIGISLYPNDGNSLSELLRNADTALYRAKDNGRNNYQFFSSAMNTWARDKLALQKALANALLKNEFQLNYQPFMNPHTRQIIGVEALIRWKNKEFGVITPSEIVTLAEETGLIIPVSDWVITAACKQLYAWHSQGYKALTMAINCSDRQFRQSTFMDDVIFLLSQSGIAPQSLEIEVTENLIMHDAEKTLRTLYALKDLGTRIVIDDFGTGYWSWQHLRRIKVDKIKIDKSYIKQAMQDETAAKLTVVMIEMINHLGIVSAAVGVETRAQYDFLIKAGCQEIQGFYLSQPLPAEAFTDFMQHPVPDAEVI